MEKPNTSLNDKRSGGIYATITILFQSQSDENTIAFYTILTGFYIQPDYTVYSPILHTFSSVATSLAEKISMQRYSGIRSPSNVALTVSGLSAAAFRKS